MRVYKLHQEDGNLFAFEIENAYIRPRRIARLLVALDGITDVRRGGQLNYSDVRIQFKYKSNDFIVWEPFGDNSRYWIGPAQENRVIDISCLVKIFEEYQPPLVVKIWGNIMTLSFKRQSEQSER